MTFHLQLGRTNRLSTSNLMVKINLDYYTSRISEIDKKPKQKKKKVQTRFQVKNTALKMAAVNKVQFATLNNKRYYCPDGITSLLYDHALLLELRKKGKHFQKFKK